MSAYAVLSVRVVSPEWNTSVTTPPVRLSSSSEGLQLVSPPVPAHPHTGNDVTGSIAHVAPGPLWSP